jgi:transcriptional regulator with XRE-family HTH domain
VWSNASRAVRALRKHRGWRQSDLARRIGRSRDVVHRVENDRLTGVTIGTVDRLVTALGGTLSIEVRWRGAELDRLVDRRHARLTNAASDRLQRLGWIVHPEVSFNHFGDRGRCDLVAWHPGTRTLLVVEVKSAVGNLQEVLGRLDVKVRLSREIAAGLGLAIPASTLGAFVLPDQGASRRVIHDHAALFRRYGTRGRHALAWLRRPASGPASGLLWFESPDVR